MIKIVEFYPFKKSGDLFIGSLRIEIVDIGVEILGVVAIKNSKGWKFLMPGRNGIDHQTGKYKRYPYINLKDEDKKKQIMKQINEEGPIFIEKRLNDMEKPIVWPEGKQKSNGCYTEYLPKPDELIEDKKSLLTDNHKKITQKVWIDPPKREMNRDRPHRK